MKTTTTRRWPLRGIAAGAATAAILAATVLSAGCDSGSFVPPPPERPVTEQSGFVAAVEGDAAKAPAVPAGPKRAGERARVVELILARPGDSDRLYLDNALRRELAKMFIPLRLRQPDSKERATPNWLAAAIRDAVGRGVAGLVVDPLQEPAVVDTLHEALGRGVAVLLLDHPVPARNGRTIPHLEFTGFEEVGRQLVQAVLARRDQRADREGPGRIVLLHHRTGDPYIGRAFDSLRNPCQAAGKPVEVLEFQGDAEPAMAALRQSLEAHTGTDIVLADDADGVFAGFRIHVDRTSTGGPGFLLAGFTSYDYRIVTFLDRIFAFGDRSVDAYATTAARAIRSLMDGKPVGDRVDVPISFYQSPKASAPVAKKPAAPAEGRKP